MFASFLAINKKYCHRDLNNWGVILKHTVSGIKKTSILQFCNLLATLLWEAIYVCVRQEQLCLDSSVWALLESRLELYWACRRHMFKSYVMTAKICAHITPPLFPFTICRYPIRSTFSWLYTSHAHTLLRGEFNEPVTVATTLHRFRDITRRQSNYFKLDR